MAGALLSITLSMRPGGEDVVVTFICEAGLQLRSQPSSLTGSASPIDAGLPQVVLFAGSGGISGGPRAGDWGSTVSEEAKVVSRW